MRALTCKASIQIELGGLDRANEALSRLADNHDPVTYYIAPALARAGEKRAAIDRLEAIVDNGWADSRFLQSDKDLDGLRREPRFRKITSALAA